MAQNNQGWREGHRYENRNLQGNTWQDENRNNRNAWQGDYQDEYGDRQYRQQHQQEDWNQPYNNQENNSYNEGNYSTAQRSNRFENNNGGGYGMNGSNYGNDSRNNNNSDRRYSGSFSNESRNDRDADRWNEFNNDWNSGRRNMQQNNNQDPYQDQQGYRNPSGGNMERYGSGDYDRNNMTGRNAGSGNWSGNSNQGSSNYNSNDKNRGNDSMSRGDHKGKGPKGYRRSDDRIQEDINDKLTDHNDLDASSIEVTVSQGEVTLSGTVDSRSSKRLAEDIAEMVSGVQNVENRIRVQQQKESGKETDTDTNAFSKKRNTSEAGTPDHQADRKTAVKTS